MIVRAGGLKQSTPDEMPVSALAEPVREAVRAFAEHHGHRWHTPRRAAGQCHVATRTFVAFLGSRGIEGRFARADHRDWGTGHTVCDVDGAAIDWTARGNDPAVAGVPHRSRGWNPRAPLPLILALEDFYSAWGQRVQVCPACGGSPAHGLQGRCYGTDVEAEQHALAAAVARQLRA